MSRLLSEQIVRADLPDCSLTYKPMKLQPPSICFRKMASNKVQSELGGRVVRCLRRTPWNQTVTDSIPATAICCVAVAPGYTLNPYLLACSGLL